MDQADHERRKEMFEHVDWIMRYFFGKTRAETPFVQEREEELFFRRVELSRFIEGMLPEEKAKALDLEVIRFLRCVKSLYLDAGIEAGMVMRTCTIMEWDETGQQSLYSRLNQKKEQGDYGGRQDPLV